MGNKKTAAVIMAGGAGERLRPITETMPKPLVPVGNTPVIESSLCVLRRLGVGEVTVTVRYLGDMIRDTYGDDYGGMKIKYHYEKGQRGTAGSTADALRGTDAGEIIVLSGDSLTDMSPASALEMHRKSGGDATLILTRSEEPWRYGVVSVDFAGRIKSFREKPDGERPGALINTGMYILSPSVLGLIPTAGEYDFGHDLFPSLAKRGGIYGLVGRGYWCDIGSPESYLKGCFDAASGCVAGMEAVVGEYGAIMAEDCRAGDHTVLDGCVLHRGVTAGDHVNARDSVFCSGVSVGSGVSIGRGCVIGSDTVIGDGVSVPNDTMIPSGSVIMTSEAAEKMQIPAP